MPFIVSACRDTGFFYVVPPKGVADELVSAQFAMAQRFFDLALASKMASTRATLPSTV